jgi:hypothetical protein
MGKKLIMRNFLICALTRYYDGDKIKDHEIGGTVVCMGKIRNEDNIQLVLKKHKLDSGGNG